MKVWGKTLQILSWKKKEKKKRNGFLWGLSDILKKMRENWNENEDNLSLIIQSLDWWKRKMYFVKSDEVKVEKISKKYF